MKTLCALVALMVAPALARAAMGMLGTNELLIAQNYASTNLATFRDTITDANYAFFGFHSPNEVLQVTNADPLLLYTIPLSRLRNYHPGDDFQALLEPSSRVIFPLFVGTNVRSSLAFRVDAARNSVSDVKFGQRKLVRELITTYGSIPPGDLQPGDRPFAVEIPVFDIWLIGHVDLQNRVILLATISLPLGPVTVDRGQRISEAAMFRLAVMAQQYNGLPN